jgi:hydrogenase nickel incorporation protein HypB
MCDHCGCGTVESFTIIPMHEHHGHSHEHGGVLHHHDHCDVPHENHHDHEHSHDHEHRTVPIHLPLLAKNDRLAERNRGFLKAKGLFAVNIVSSPGSGKTTLIAKTLEMAAGSLPAAVIVGDLETANDAARLRDKGAPVVQVTTGTVCHLDAEMIGHALEHLDMEGRLLLIIENVGNLVCPASYDLGEALRVVLISVTEGEDKPLKYPPIFHGTGVVIVSKTDMLAASGLDLEVLRRNIRAVAPEAEIIEVSARTGEGMEQWMALLDKFAKI